MVRLRTMFFRCLGLAACVVACALTAVAQRPVYEAKIPLIVTDKEGAFIGGLEKRDFIVTVGDRRIEDFEINLQTRPAAVVLAIDNSGSLRTSFASVMEGARAFFPQGDQGNMLLLMRFVGRDKIQIAEKFSSDHAFLESRMKLFAIEGGQTALVDAIYKAVQIVAGQDNLSPDSRRSVVVISDGEDRDSLRSQAELRELILKEPVQVFFVGLTDLLPKNAGFITKSPKKSSEEFIDALTTDSGGVAVFPKSKEIQKAAVTIQKLLNQQYVLAIRSTAPIESGAKVEIGFAPGSDRKKMKLHLRRVLQALAEKN